MVVKMETLGCLKLMSVVFGAEQIDFIIDQWLSSMSPRERHVIEMRFGLMNDTTPRTLEDIGKEFSVSSERVRQIEIKALRLLRLRVGFTTQFCGLFRRSEVDGNSDKG